MQRFLMTVLLQRTSILSFGAPKKMNSLFPYQVDVNMCTCLYTSTYIYNTYMSIDYKEQKRSPGLHRINGKNSGVNTQCIKSKTKI